ncbi:tRNA dihydrouridine synthase DusB [Leptospira weilii]|uniref:tRNA-dihydrouridine synthase n=3 Tax=Leptospira weilii TaxID=28184 RepID=N1U6H9_9LEPT|nr:tRNA dihydrouridine synthase DusB [Leptospira weilii]EMM74484.1 TIM-barrel protein, nifR3 family [Leptospira weilii str. 2006001855]EMY16088.1 TIM-barrel protein, nifR3 family [Leptospira weilii str. Ecochallenge]EMN45710.1 TIM-barrel protein, nifR3 family [Leptospira weilii str. LNT 1234]EMN88227.1 TIM-barrel protein, nifR3 family [Leptospira weilii str. UI 13098]MCL8266208.1 tRNA dihydrouridine synthase DusB [Leptospira weilii]
MIRIGDVTIPGRISLSPMAGISDSPTRRICRKFGAAFSYTEFVNTDELVHRAPKAFKMFRFHPEERPIAFQIFGNRLEIIAEAAEIIQELKPDIIDLNMGCSTRKVSLRGAGAGLLRKPALAGKIIEAIKKRVNVPVTAKIRIGWDSESRNYLEVSKILEESGVSALTVHGRTKEMAYTGLADWDAIGEVKARRKIPVFGNGDIKSYEEANSRMREYNLDGVLIGRNAIGNPWIFSKIKKEELYWSEILEVILEHARWMIQDFGEEFGLVLFRKHLVKYLNGLEFDPLWKTRLLEIREFNPFEECLFLPQASKRFALI